MARRDWSDQPNEIERSELLCSLLFGGTLARIYIGDRGTYLVSAGNLFGSQTVRVPGSTAAFAALEAISKRRDDEQAKLPGGWEIVPNDEAAEPAPEPASDAKANRAALREAVERPRANAEAHLDRWPDDLGDHLADLDDLDDE